MTGFTPKMAYIGTISGVGDVRVFGLARHTVDENRTDTVYLNIAGPATSVESIWARILERYTVTLMPIDDSVSRTPLHIRHGGLGDDETPFVRYQQRIPSLAIDHLFLLDRRFVQVEYADVGIAFVFNKHDACFKVADHVHQLVNVATFPEWDIELTRIGYKAGLIKSVQCFGGQEVYMVNLDRTLWEHRISLAVERNELTWPSRNGAKIAVSTPTGEILGVADRTMAPPAAALEPKESVIPAVSGASPIYDHTFSVNTLPSPEGVVRDIMAAMREKQASHPSPQSVRSNGTDGPPKPSESPQPDKRDEGKLACEITYEGDWTWLAFTDKPDEATRNTLKRNGFRWGQRRQAWYCRRNIPASQIEQLLGTTAATRTEPTTGAPSVDIPIGGKRSQYFRSISHYTQKRRAIVTIAEAFREARWTIHGWHEDRSDPMTDYYAPASWDGVASKGDMVIVVDGDYAAKNRSGTDGWPTFQSSPGNSNWHVEYKGKIVAQGTGLARCCREYYEGGEVLSHRGSDEPKLRPEQKAARGFVERVEALRTFYEKSNPKP